MPRILRFAFAWAAGISLILLVGCSRQDDKGDLSREDRSADSLSTRFVTVREVSVSSSGQVFESYLYAAKDAFVVAKVSGMIREVYVELGDDVNGGDTLVRVEDELPYLEFELARNACDQATQDFERYQTLHDKNLISQREYEQAKLRCEQADIERRCALERFRHTRLVAPFSGVVVSSWARSGQVVEAGDSLFHITQRSPVYTRVFLTEEEHTRLKTEGRVKVQPKYGAQRSAWGTVVNRSPAIDPVAGTVELVIRIDPRFDFCKPGMTVNVSLETNSPPTILALPKTAFHEAHRFSSQETTVVHVRKNGAVTRRVLQLGEDLDSLWEVTGDIATGDSVIVLDRNNLRIDRAIQMDSEDAPGEE
ncbi:MAG: efflux RND transporter periplasmic adaptor subunit [Candidatus Zixiibacteriota bacterium]|nr:MAG: efflux RND transporter periplasmic adaptor subunit [candidate division Zixibacteria bacterium]